MVDDSRVQRRILSSQLARAGHAVLEAGSAEEALDLFRRVEPDLIISGWMMNGQTGLDLCRGLRALGRDDYIYFILLTSKSEAAEIARGLDVGADDVLTKPVSGDELRARISAGRRILAMQRELRDKNRLLGATLGELQGLYDSIDRDLLEARRLQQGLVGERRRDFGAAEVSLLWRPSGHVGGDLVGLFPINTRRAGVFAIDVSGHGITAALMTARLAGCLSGSSPDRNIALVPDGRGGYDARPPEDLAAALNALVLNGMQAETYFTLAYADIDLVSGRVAMVQAGHPHPALIRAGGRIEFAGSGGLPVGLIDGAGYERIEARLSRGDRLFLMSDGITEAADPSGTQLGREGLAAMIGGCIDLSGAAFLDALCRRIDDHSGGEAGDDVSGVLVEFHGPGRAAG